MSLPIIEQIAELVEKRVNGVKRSLGYNVTLTGERRQQRGVTVRDMLTIIEQGGADPVQDPEITEGVGFSETFNFTIFSVESERSDVPIDRQLNIAAADLERALMIDPQWNDLAVDTTLSGREVVDDTKGRFGAIVVRIAIYYRTKEHDPYTNA